LKPLRLAFPTSLHPCSDSCMQWGTSLGPYIIIEPHSLWVHTNRMFSVVCACGEQSAICLLTQVTLGLFLSICIHFNLPGGRHRGKRAVFGGCCFLWWWYRTISFSMQLFVGGKKINLALRKYTLREKQSLETVFI
jgi:hypothetical protein